MSTSTAFHALDPSNSFDGVNNLAASVTINSHAETPQFRFKGGDADATDWNYWTYGADLLIDGTGTAPTYNAGSPLLGSNDDSVHFNTGKTYEGTAACFELGANEDMLFEFVIKTPPASAGTMYLFRWFGTRDMKVSWVGSGTNELRLNLAAGGTVASGTLEPDTWYHCMVFVNRDYSSTDASRWIINGYESGSGNDFSAADGLAFPGGTYTFNIGGSHAGTFTYSGNVAYVAAWMYNDWFQDSSAALTAITALAKERFFKLCGVWAETANGEAEPTYDISGSTIYYPLAAAVPTKFIDKYVSGVRSLYKVKNNWPRCCSRYIDGAVFKGYLGEGSHAPAYPIPEMDESMYPLVNMFYNSTDMTDDEVWTEEYFTQVTESTVVPPDAAGTAFKIQCNQNNSVGSVYQTLSSKGDEWIDWAPYGRDDALYSRRNGERHVISAWFKSDVNDHASIRLWSTGPRASGIYLLTGAPVYEYCQVYFNLSNGTVSPNILGIYDVSNGLDPYGQTPSGAPVYWNARVFWRIETGIEAWGNGWYRCWISWNQRTPAYKANIQCQFRVADAFYDDEVASGDSVIIYGPQWDHWDSPRSYIETEDRDTYIISGIPRTPWLPTEKLTYEGRANLGPQQTGKQTGNETRQQGWLQADIGYERHRMMSNFIGPAVCLANDLDECFNFLMLDYMEADETDSVNNWRTLRWMLYGSQSTQGGYDGCDNHEKIGPLHFCGVRLEQFQPTSIFGDDKDTVKVEYRQVFDDSLVWGDEFRLFYYLNNLKINSYIWGFDYCRNDPGHDEYVSDLAAWNPNAASCEFNKNFDHICVGYAPLFKNNIPFPHPVPASTLINNVKITYTPDSSVCIEEIRVFYEGKQWVQTGMPGEADWAHLFKIEAEPEADYDWEVVDCPSPPCYYFYWSNYTQYDHVPAGWDQWPDCDGEPGYPHGTYNYMNPFEASGVYWKTVKMFEETSGLANNTCDPSGKLTMHTNPGDIFAVTVFEMTAPMPTPAGGCDQTFYFQIPQEYTHAYSGIVASTDYDGFTLQFPFEGDWPQNGSASYWYCNHTTVSGCDPRDGVSGVMTRDDRGWYYVDVEDLDLNTWEPGDLINWEMEITDPDGVSGVNPVSGVLQLEDRDGIWIHSAGIEDITNTGFTANVDFEWDWNENAIVSGWWCNRTDDPDCDPFEDGTGFQMTRVQQYTTSGYFTYAVSGLSAPNDPDDMIAFTLIPYDEDSSLDTVTGLFQLTEVELTVTSGIVSDTTSTSFEVTQYFVGDSNENSSATLYWCNNTDNPGCDPLAGSSAAMSRSGNTFVKEITGLSTPNDPADYLNWKVTVSDPDGVNDTPASGIAQLDPRNDIIISNYQVVAQGENNFTVKCDYDWDMNSDAIVAGWWCSETDSPGCNPSNEFSMTRYPSDSYSGYFQGSVSGLGAQYVGDQLNIKITASDPDGVSGSPLEGNVQLSSNSTILASGLLDAPSASSFDVTVYYSGDDNQTGRVYAYYCDHTTVSGCDPTAGNYTELTRDDSDSFSGSVTGLPANNPGHTYNVNAVAVDSDGVFNSPLDLGQVTLVSDHLVRFIPGTNTEYAVSEINTVSGIDLGEVNASDSRLESFQLANLSTVDRIYVVSADGDNTDILADVEFSNNRREWDATASGLIPNSGFSDTIWVKYSPSEGSVVGEGTFKIKVEVV